MEQNAGRKVAFDSNWGNKMEQKSMLICRYLSICEPDVIDGFRKNGYVVDEFNEKMKEPDYDTVYMKKLSEVILKGNYEFVFSINFFPIISKLCNVLKIPYVCWIVDSPVFQMYSDALKGQYNRVFIFDRALYEQYYPKNPEGIFHLPLAANPDYFDSVCETITPAEKVKYGKDIAFIGSLYTEKCPYNKIKVLPEYLKGYLESIMTAQLKIYGYNFLPEVLTPEIVKQFKEVVSWEASPEDYEIDDAMFIADEYLGVKISEMERIEMLNLLAEHFPVHFYTQSDTSCLKDVIVCGSAESRIEMPKIFHCSKINLNPTAKSIKTGISQRIWDIMGAGGFVMSNYQTELFEHFEPGVDIEYYGSMEELVHKCAYYLEHDEERREIAKNGYEKVKKYHTYEIRIKEMLEIVRNSF